MENLMTRIEEENSIKEQNPISALTQVTQEALFNEFIQNEELVKPFGATPKNYKELASLDDAYQTYLRQLMVAGQINDDQYDTLVEDRSIKYQEING